MLPAAARVPLGASRLCAAGGARRQSGLAAVRWEDGVAHSTFPAIDLRLPATTRLTEYCMRNFDRYGDKLAVVDGVTGDRRSFHELTLDVNAVGLGLRDEFGVKAGDCVALMTLNHVDFFACVHGPSKLGAMVTPINSSYREREIEVQLLNSKAKVAICHSDVIAHVRQAAVAVSKQTGGRPVAVLDIDADVGRLRQDGRRPGTKLLPKTPATARDTVYLPYSSGTTGLPKGVMLTHSNLVSNLLQSDHIDCRHYAQDDVTISPLPLFHIYGFLASLHNPVINGNTLVTMKRFDFERFLQLVQEHKAARAHLVPPILLALSKSPLVDKYNLKSLKMIISAAAPLGIEVDQAVTKRLGCRLKQFWGMSELSPLGTGPTDDHVKPGFVGPPVANTAVKVIDLKSGKALGPGLEGELCLKGPQVMRGYLNAPEKTAECLMPDGWFKTGDIALIDQDGYVKITDRLKELIKYKGFQVPPAELEDLLISLPEVLDACVIPVPNEEAGELARAYVVLRPEFKDKVSEKQIADQLAALVAHHKKLYGGCVFVDKIPKTESGKLLRRMVIEMDRKRSQQ